MLKRKVGIVVCLLLLGVMSACGRSTASEKPASGWIKLEGIGMEMWLPESYIGGDSAENLDSVVSKMRTLDADFEAMAQKIEQNSFLYDMWAFDSEVGESGFLTNVSVISEEASPDMSEDSYLDLWAAQLPAQFQVVDRGTVSVGDGQAERLYIEATLYDIPAKEVLYVIKNESTFWVITFATGLAEFDQRLPEFEQAISTFSVQP